MSCAGGGRMGGRSVDVLFLLHFQFGGENGRGSGRNRHISGFGAAVTVENFHRVTGGHDFRQSGERCSHNIHAADKLIRPAIRNTL